MPLSLGTGLPCVPHSGRGCSGWLHGAAFDPRGWGRAGVRAGPWLSESSLAGSPGLAAAGTQLSPVPERESTWATEARGGGPFATSSVRSIRSPGTRQQQAPQSLACLGSTSPWATSGLGRAPPPPWEGHCRPSSSLSSPHWTPVAPLAPGTALNASQRFQMSPGGGMAPGWEPGLLCDPLLLTPSAQMGH